MAMCQASLLKRGASQQALVLGIALEAVEHRVGGEPAGDLRPVRLERLLQPLEGFRLLAPEGEEGGEVVVKEEVVGVESARLLVRALGLRVEALLGVADAEIEVGLEVLGLQPDDLLQLRDGAAVVALVHEEGGELVAREGVGRVELDGGLELGDGLLDPSVVCVGEAEVEVGVGILGVELDRLLVGGDGELRAVRGEEAGEVVVSGGAVGLELEGGEVLAEGLAVELLLGVDGGEVVVGVRGVGIEVDGLAELADGLVEPAAIGELDATGVVLVGERDVVLLAGHGGGAEALYSAENRLCKLHSCADVSPVRRSDSWRFALGCMLGGVIACAPRATVRPEEVQTRAEPPLTLAPAPAEPVPPRPITLVVGGDVTLGAHYEEWVDALRAKGQSGPAVDGWGFSEVKPLFAGADLVLVNLECPFTGRGEPIPKNFNFRARPSTVSVLIDAGVRAVSLANNHLMDFGPDGVADTIATLDAAGIAHFGAGANLAEARRPAIVEVGGLKIAFLGYLIL